MEKAQIKSLSKQSFTELLALLAYYRERHDALHIINVHGEKYIPDLRKESGKICKDHIELINQAIDSKMKAVLKGHPEDITSKVGG